MSQTLERQGQLSNTVRESLRPFAPNVRPAGDEAVATGLGDGPHDPRLDALSAAVAKLVSDYGRHPTNATSWRVDDGCVVTALEDFMTPAEQELVETGAARFVRQLRSAFGEAITDEYVRAAEAGLGRKVIAHRSEVMCASGICLEIFLLASEPLSRN